MNWFHGDQLSDHARGSLTAFAGVTVLSVDALLIRLVAAEGWDVVFWRGLFIFAVMSLMATLQGKWKGFWDPAQRRAALLVATLYGIGMALFVLSVSLTKVANTVVILTSSPFFAALFSWWLIGEMIRMRTVIAIIACMLGVGIVFSSSLGTGNWIGDALALLLAAVMGLALTVLRQHHDIPRVPMIAVSGLIAAGFSVWFADPLSLSPQSYGWLALMGLLQMPLASVLIMVATRYLPSPEVSLFLLIETVLGPVWVWLVIGEVPPSLALVGGVIVILTIAIHSTLALRGR